MIRIRAILIALTALLASGLPVAAQAPERQGMTFSAKVYDPNYLRPNRVVFLHGEGVFDRNTPARLREIIRRYQVQPGSHISLSSPGGSVISALEVGRIIRAHSMSTSVGNVAEDVQGRYVEPPPALCASACTLAFLGGVERTIGSRNAYGVHRFFVNGADIATSAEANDRAQIISSVIVGYIAEMGVDTALFREMAKAGSRDLNVLSGEQMAALRVTTPDYKTTWELAQNGPAFYLRGQTEDARGRHKFLLMCNPVPAGQRRTLELMAMFDGGTEVQNIASFAHIARLTSDKGDINLTAKEITGPTAVSNAYVVISFLVTPRIENILRSARTLGFAFLPPSEAIFYGWTGDLAQDRRKVVAFMEGCI